MADYILLANKQNNIYPEEFSSPHIIHKEESLDELLDNPLTVDAVENNARPIQKSIFKKEKRKIDRNSSLQQNIPGMTDLWAYIDSIKQKLDAETAQNTPTAWRTKRLLISLYKQQYLLLENYLPENIIQNNTYHRYTKPQNHFYQWYRGIQLNNGETAYLDLCNTQHMAQFLLHYIPLSEYCTDFSSDLYELLSDVSAAIVAANLTPFQLDILHLYQWGKPSHYIISYIEQKYARKLNQTYLSVVFHKQISSKIAEEYAEIYHSRIWSDDPTKWRICLGCKQKKLLTKHNFHRFSSKPGGFSLYCKDCVAAKKGANNAQH